MIMEGRFVSESEQDTELIAEKLGYELSGGETVALFGGLGMGKTAFVRGLAKGLGIDSIEISSPTFAIVHEHFGRVPLYHFDMYRVESWDDLYSTGFFEYTDGVIVTEWSENIENALAEPRYEVRISKDGGDNQRTIDITRIGGKGFENSCD